MLEKKIKTAHNGFFGEYGGQFVPDEIKLALDEIAEAYDYYKNDPAFQAELQSYLKDYSGRETPLYYAESLTKALGGAKDTERQKLNVFRMELLGAKVVGVTRGNQTLKEAVDVAFEDLATHLDDTFYVVGSAVGPHPYPLLVRDFQSVISKEMKQQILEKEGVLPDAVVACVGGGSNAIGSFAHFVEDEEVRLIGVEAAGKGLDTEHNAATISKGRITVDHGMNTYFLADEDGDLKATHSISAGLDYPGVGPEHAYLHAINRAEFTSVTDQEALNAFVVLSKAEGIIPALESSHAVAHALKMAPEMDKDQIVLINLSGRGDKDVKQVADFLDDNY